jgi:hypothetical protein
MKDQDLSQRIDNAMKYLGPRELINEFLNWLSKDDVKHFLDHLETDYQINTKVDPD